MRATTLKQAVQKVGAHNRGINFPTRASWTPVVPDWPVIPETIKKIAAAATGAGRPPLIAPQDLGTWTPVGEPDRIEVVRIGINLLKRKPISDEEIEAINAGTAY